MNTKARLDSIKKKRVNIHGWLHKDSKNNTIYVSRYKNASDHVQIQPVSLSLVVSINNNKLKGVLRNGEMVDIVVKSQKDKDWIRPVLVYTENLKKIKIGFVRF